MDTGPKLITIAEFWDAEKAHLLSSSLQTAGIQAVVVGSESATTLAYFGSAVTQVKVQVRDEDLQAAREQLHIASATETALGDWICHQCGAEVDAGFEVCWSCGTTYDPQLATRSTSSHSQAAESLAGDEEALRAWRASVLSVVFPPLVLYTVFILVICADLPMSGRGTRFYYSALVVAVLIGSALCSLFGLWGPFLL